jgi:hypothetical protein
VILILTMQIKEHRSVANLIKFFGGGIKPKNTTVNAYSISIVDLNDDICDEAKSHELSRDALPQIQSIGLPETSEDTSSVDLNTNTVDVKTKPAEVSKSNRNSLDEFKDFKSELNASIAEPLESIDIIDNSSLVLNTPDSKDFYPALVTKNGEENIIQTSTVNVIAERKTAHEVQIVVLENELIEMGVKNTIKNSREFFEMNIVRSIQASKKSEIKKSTKELKYMEYDQKVDSFYTGFISGKPNDTYFESRKNKGKLLKHLSMMLMTVQREDGLVKPSKMNFKEAFDVMEDDFKPKNWNKFR